MGACSEDVTTHVSVPLTLHSTTVAAVQAVPLTIPNGHVFTPALTGAVILTFTSPTIFTLVGAEGLTATGVVTSTPPACQFDVRVPGGLLSTAALLPLSTCALLINARNVEEGGDAVSRTVTLSLSGASGAVGSNVVTAQVSLNDAGELFVVNPVTGVAVDMGVQL
jgi:hypothetical protein